MGYSADPPRTISTPEYDATATNGNLTLNSNVTAGTGQIDLAARGANSLLTNNAVVSNSGAPSVIVCAAAGVAKASLQMMQQHVADTRIERCCGRAVEINGSHQNAIISQECGC